MNEDQMQQMGSLFDERICQLLIEISESLDEADTLIQKTGSVDKARIRIAHANATAHAAVVLLRPNAVVVEGQEPAAVPGKIKQFTRKFLPGD